MSLFKDFFKKAPKPVVHPMARSAPLQTDEERDAIRSRMEAEMTTERERHQASIAKNLTD